MPSFSERLIQLRKDRGLTQQQLSTALEIHTRGLQNYESGRIPEAAILIKIADFFNVSTDYLLGRGDEEGAPNHAGNVDDVDSTSVEREFLKWVDENLEGSFFYDFAKSPEESKREMMRSLRIIWELEKNRKPGDKQSP